MIALVGEAVRATVQPCTFLLLVPTLAAVLAARSTPRALGAALVAAIAGGWLLAAGGPSLGGGGLRASAVGTLAAFAVAPGAARRWRDGVAGVVGPVAAGAVTLVATSWWRPCVGPELGRVLTGARHGLAAQLLPMAVYMVGVLVPVIAVVLVVEAAGRPARPVGLLAGGSAAAGAALALVVVVGRHDELVSTLARWTTG